MNEETIFDSPKQSQNVTPNESKPKAKEKGNGKGNGKLGTKAKVGVAAGAAGVAGLGLMSFTLPSRDDIDTENADEVDGPIDGAEQPEVCIPDSLEFATGIDDSMSFGEAFAAARAEVGPGGLFVWHGQTYPTYYQEEWDALTDESRDEYTSGAEKAATEHQQPAENHAEDPGVTPTENSPAPSEEPAHEEGPIFNIYGPVTVIKDVNGNNTILNGEGHRIYNGSVTEVHNEDGTVNLVDGDGNVIAVGDGSGNFHVPAPAEKPEVEAVEEEPASEVEAVEEETGTAEGSEVEVVEGDPHSHTLEGTYFATKGAVFADIKDGSNVIVGRGNDVSSETKDISMRQSVNHHDDGSESASAHSGSNIVVGDNNHIDSKTTHVTMEQNINTHDDDSGFSGEEYITPIHNNDAYPDDSTLDTGASEC